MKYELNVPTNLKDITLGQYQQYIKLPEGLTENQIALKMVTIFCNVSDKVARHIKASDIQTIVTKLSNMFSGTPPLKRRFKIGNVEYGFIPNLDDMSFGEYIDLDTYLGDWDNIEQYEVKDATIYKNMPLDAVLGSIVFFYNLGNELCQTMIAYSHNQGDLQQKATLELNGVGINQYTDWLTEILQDLKVSLN